MTAQATRAPAFPVVDDNSWPPLPRSSGSACTWRERKSSWRVARLIYSCSVYSWANYPNLHKKKKKTTAPHHQGSTDDVMCSIKSDQLVGQIDNGLARFIRDHVAQIADMTFGIWRASVSFAQRIEMRASWHASIRVVSELMHVESVKSRSEALDLARHLNCITLWEKKYSFFDYSSSYEYEHFSEKWLQGHVCDLCLATVRKWRS